MPDIVLTTLPSLAKSYFHLLKTRKPGIQKADEIPRVTCELKSFRPSKQDYEDYCDVCGVVQANDVFPVYPQSLANALHAQLVLSERFPVKGLRLVHKSNSIEVRRPLRLDETWDFEASVEKSRDVAAGVEVDFHTQISVDGQWVWRSVSTLLVRSKSGGARKKREVHDQDMGQLFRTTFFRVPGYLGRHYASASGDYNPIHLHSLLAKAFGFPKAIIHGLWSFARCVAELDTDLPEYPLRLHVEFKRPVYLPSALCFNARRHEDRIVFELQTPKTSKIHVLGSVQKLADVEKTSPV
jgi:acyl dehydratase